MCSNQLSYARIATGGRIRTGDPIVPNEVTFFYDTLLFLTQITLMALPSGRMNAIR